MTAAREREVTQALLALADHLVSGDDVFDLLSELAATAVQLLEVASCGVLLADRDERLHVVAASSDSARTLELLQVKTEEGPCVASFRSGSRVGVEDLSARESEWPTFVHAARRAGFASVHAIPLRLRDHMLGAMGLFDTTPGALSPEDWHLAETLGHATGIILVAQRVVADQKLLADQLQRALDSRVVIEQCKGILAEAGGLEMDQAFRVLRKYARDHNLGLTAVASAVVERRMRPELLLERLVR